MLAIAELAAQITGMPMAAVNIMTADQQHTIATVGFDSDVCRRDDSMCGAVLSEKSPVVVPDASLDPRFRDNPFVTGQLGAVRFYASHRLVDRDGVVIGTLCVFDDEPRILDDREARALGVLAERIVDVLELALRGRQLEASNDRLSHFAGRVSHDLKTPLTSISMTLQLIQEQLDERDDTDDTGWLIEKALKGSDRMAAMIDGILAYATAGGSVERARVDLGAVAADALADLRSELDGVPVVVRDLPTVLGDEVQLRTLLQNLLANAAKYRDPDRPLQHPGGRGAGRAHVADPGHRQRHRHPSRAAGTGLPARRSPRPGPAGLGHRPRHGAPRGRGPRRHHRHRGGRRRRDRRLVRAPVLSADLSGRPVSRGATCPAGRASAGARPAPRARCRGRR